MYIIYSRGKDLIEPLFEQKVFGGLMNDVDATSTKGQERATSVPNSTSAPPFGRSGRGRGILTIALDGQSLDLKPSGPTDLLN